MKRYRQSLNVQSTVLRNKANSGMGDYKYGKYSNTAKLKAETDAIDHELEMFDTNMKRVISNKNLNMSPQISIRNR